MPGSVVIQQPDPLSAAAEAFGTFQTNQRQNALDAQAKARADAQLKLQQNADARDAQRLADTEGQTTVENARAQAAADLAARQEGETELQDARNYAISVLNAQNAKTKNDQDYAFKMKQLTQQFAIEKAKLQNATGVAQIRAAAETGAANIRAAAEVESAGITSAGRVKAATISSQGADKRAAANRSVTVRGQDLAHKDRVSAQERLTAAHLATAVTALRKIPGAPAPPTDDPHFDEALKAFADASPADRDASLADPRIPASTKRYLQAIEPQLTILGQ